MDLEEIKERSERDWAELVNHYTLNSERAEACANQQMKDVRDLIAEVERLTVNNELYQQQNEMNAQQYTECCEVNRRQFEALFQVEKERDRYKAALEDSR